MPEQVDFHIGDTVFVARLLTVGVIDGLDLEDTAAEGKRPVGYRLKGFGCADDHLFFTADELELCEPGPFRQTTEFFLRQNNHGHDLEGAEGRRHDPRRFGPPLSL